MKVSSRLINFLLPVLILVSLDSGKTWKQVWVPEKAVRPAISALKAGETLKVKTSGNSQDLGTEIECHPAALRGSGLLLDASPRSGERQP